MASSFSFVFHLSVPLWLSSPPHGILTFALECTAPFSLPAFRTISTLNSHSVLYLWNLCVFSLIFLSCPNWFEILWFSLFSITKKDLSTTKLLVLLYSYSLATYIYLPIIVTFLSCKILCLLKKVNLKTWLEATIWSEGLSSETCM